ncbi:hypothetical protein G6F33_012704 [Rhizopus arrhizus]|nr:hypothetical protein G6F34_012966 [Rhizopus arrhizus]KAG0904736.1 hypothetical protein G6F33_012704 [Rhizopus arrhizus]KAG0975421.1 hypothetical protein G6F28_012928 [Rhizopus arrhizus]KAG1060237.1 hypothetical protein G6F41_012989 [Rhizopus arrhizus]KAG1084677.1 hypothetical protein G6F39_012997 [Rhizopus arrhizus]
MVLTYHPRANGIVERWVGKAKNILHKRLQGRTEDWDLYVDSTQEALNNTHTALHGTRPFSLMFARRPNENKDYNNVLDKTKSPETMKYKNYKKIAVLKRRGICTFCESAKYITSHAENCAHRKR